MQRRLALLLAIAVIALFRRPDAFFNPQLFVEDGTVFFRDDHMLGVDALWQPYAGYLHLLPRLIALGASTAPLEWRPRIYTHACLAVLFMVALITTGRRVQLPHKALFALAPMLLPIGPFIYLHLTNIQWFSSIALMMLLLQQPAQNPREAVADASVALLVGLTGPFSIVMGMLWPMRYLSFKFKRWDALPALAILGAAAVQSLFLLGAKKTAAGGFGHATFDFFARHGNRLALGDVLSRLLSPGQTFPTTLLALSLVIIVASASRPRLGAHLFFICACIFGTLSVYRMQPEAAHANAFRSGIRYFFLPHLYVSFVFVSGLAHSRWPRHLALGCIGLTLLSATSAFTYRPPIDTHFERYCDRIRSGKPVVVPLVPKGWRMRLN